MHALIVRKIERDPKLLEVGHRNIARWAARYAEPAPAWLNEWREILSRPWPEIVSLLTEQSENAARLHSCRRRARASNSPGARGTTPATAGSRFDARSDYVPGGGAGSPVVKLTVVAAPAVTVASCGSRNTMSSSDSASSRFASQVSAAV